MFVDASALVAIVTREPDASTLVRRIQEAAEPITSPLALYEAAMAISRKIKGGPRAAKDDLGSLLALVGVRVVPITPEDADQALAAHEQYGKGAGHPARLNMGDCFAYAVAKGHGVSLLYKGEDFIHTDLGGM
ncbi:type II toxin-antitoxin system VapC family toxin [Methylobacterium haplocladii]|uniref:Ribonuclease VapC n=1 Tax=Methylobacterium haplocladii TaxID=1176176 RepID=A0A512INW8_9HYPH|nr:type II toxin-antitoxin system VapC family toxin [Methylobacterium haplocladii]GEO99397.1 ribonuclease VapC [Methylobacterium haplocladii]GJD85910.1 Ribonuclease VapC42 [Methylobacterium haplocladii]GLS60255.1 ribonuclease VapC [Methylobacterium haplocladii]